MDVNKPVNHNAGSQYLKRGSAILKAGLAGFFLLTATSVASEAQRICAKHEQIIAFADQRRNEKPIARAIAANGFLIEVLSSEEGTFTVISTTPTGVSCVIINGEGWQSIDDPTKASWTSRLY